MAAIAIRPIIQISSTPFCDKSCKGLRVFSKFLGRSVYALGLLIVSIACRVFNRDLSCIYFSMAKAQFNRGGNALVTYFKFGRELIDFAYNGCTIAPSSDTEQNALRARYGLDAINHWLQIGTEEIPLRPENLKRAETGICLGMSLDFMKQYLLQIQEGTPSTQAIRKICSRYVTGAPDESQLAQIFYSALDSTRMIEREWARLDAPIEEGRQETLRWLREQEEQVYALPQDQIAQRLTQIQTQYNERLKNFRFQSLSNKTLAVARIEAQRSAIISNQFGLQMGPAQIYANEEIAGKCDAEFSRLVEALPDGCYAGGFRAKECAHAVSLIKSNNKYFLFDPNFGTLVFERDTIAEKLWSIGKTFYLKNGLCSFSFSSCSLR